MTLTELKYLVTLARLRHFGRAAEACFVSQPTLSVAINKLEKKLDIAIFERQHGEVRVTDIGEKIIAQAQRVLEESAALEAIAASNRSQLDAPLKIGGIFTIAPYIFPKLLPKLIKLAPDMPIIVQEDYTANLRHKLQSGLLDVIFISLPFTEPGVVCKTMYSEKFEVLMRNDHALAKKASVDADALNDENVLLLGEGHCFRDQVIQACPSCYHPSNLQQTVEGTSLETIRHMVLSGIGVTVLPESATDVHLYKKLLVSKPFKKSAPKRSVALAWRSSFPRTKAIDLVIKAIAGIKV